MFLTPRIRRWRRAASLVTAVIALPALSVVATGASSATAATVPCGTRVTSTPFAQWGDTKNYFVLQGGTFESGASGWSLAGGAATAAGNEPWSVAGGGSRALALPSGATAATPSFCVTPSESLVRFFYRAPGKTGSVLNVTVTVTRGSKTASTSLLADGGVTGWQVSPPVVIPDIVDPATTSTVTVTFRPQNSTGATWLVDDFHVDPWKSLR